MLSKKWKFDHWELYYNGDFICSCDDSELEELKIAMEREILS